jgi:hypothetical protein
MPEDKIPCPCSVPLTVLSADAPENTTIGFTVREYLGSELFKVVEGKPVIEPIPATEELVEGQQYCAASLFGGYHVGVIVRDEYTLYLDTGGLIGTLCRGEDDRNAWTMSCWINKKCLDKLTLSSQG